MAKKPKSPDAITTRVLPRICPACAYDAPIPTRESGGVTRVTCPQCMWSERYLVVPS